MAAASSGCDRVRTATAAPRETPVPTVTVVRARKMDVPIIRLPNGTTRALNEVTIRARVKGFLKEMHFNEGSNVKKDDLLLVIDEEPFKVKVAQAKAVLEEAEAALKKAKESRAKEVAKAQVSLDETQLQLDRVEERRERNLLARKAASQEDYDQAKAKVEKSAAQVEADSASLQQAMADYDINILSAQAKIDQARADLEAAQDRSRLLPDVRADRRPDRRAAGEARQPRGSGDLDGRYDLAGLDPAARSHGRRSPTRLALSAGHHQAGQERAGGQAEESAARGPILTRARITFVDNTVESTTSTVLVKAEVPNPDQTILPGEYVKVEVNIGDYAGAIVVPEAAVVEAQEGSRVLVVDDQNKVTGRGRQDRWMSTRDWW